jgi:hypothetical protein
VHARHLPQRLVVTLLLLLLLLHLLFVLQGLLV